MKKISHSIIIIGFTRLCLERFTSQFYKGITSMLVTGIVLLLFAGCKPTSNKSGDNEITGYLMPVNAKHSVVYHEPGKFAGWPANNGVWIWDGQEVLVGLTVGPYEVRNGHNLGEPYVSLLSRSLDGGHTWEAYDPENYIGDGGELPDLVGSLNHNTVDQGNDFLIPDLALRVTGIGYHGNVLPEGGYYYSPDRGRTWSGPFALNGLEQIPALDTMELSPRTDYIINNDGSVQVFISARVPGVFGSDRLFCAMTKDGGLNFKLQSWVVPLEDPYRAVMSSSVRCSETKLVSSVRRREIGTDRCWVDVYVSENNGDSWKFLSKVGDTGPENGNPPALLRLKDGRLICAFGQREQKRQQIVARISNNEGAEWGPEIILRNDFQADEHNNSDLGYPRMVQRSDGKIVTMYYWATGNLVEHQIAATIWDPEDLKSMN